LGASLAESLNGLRDRIKGELRWDPVTRSLYAAGACLYRVLPRAVLWPMEREDVVEAMELASRDGIPVTAMGGGTSRTGNELGEGLVIDFSLHMNRILELDPQARLVRVEPGVVLADLNELLKPHGLFFPPDPSTKDHCTIGGMIANNSSGPMSVKYGTTRAYVEWVEMVLSNGETIRTGPGRVGETGALGKRERTIYGVVADVIGRYRQALTEERPAATKDSSGYHLWEVERSDGLLDLTPMVVGSEGTLGIVTQAALKLMPIVPARLSAIVYFRELSTVGEATQRILEHRPCMVEIMERQILELARKHNPSLSQHLPEGTEAILVVELEGQEEARLREEFSGMAEELLGGALACDFRVASGPQEMALFSKIRSISGPILNRIKGSRKPRAFIEDPAVHPSRLPEYIEGLRRLFREHAVEASIYGHAGDGNLHSMVFLDLSRPEEIQRMAALSSDVYDLVLRLGGTISGEHGDGRLRTQFLPRQYPRLYQAFQEIKAAFDPEGILNPGIIVGPAGQPLQSNLRFKAINPSGRRGSLDHPGIQEEIQACSGCGKCRSYCPVARSSRQEWAAGRGKISLIREILTGELPDSVLTSAEARRVMELCINCKRCLRECPSGVDVPWVALCGRQELVAREGERLANRILTDTRLLCALGSGTAPLSNVALCWPPARRLLEGALGLDSRRSLPPFSRSTARARALTGGEGRAGQVALFLSCHANFNDPQGEGLAAMAVLERNGRKVLLPDVGCCAMARINGGAGPKVMGQLRYNVNTLAPIAREGIPILFTEPSCLLAVKMEYPRLLASEEAQLVARNCMDIHEFLLDLYERGALDTAMAPIHARVGYHSPCHLRALGDGQAPGRLLALVPGLEVIPYGDLCCGMGGTFGLKVNNARLSKHMGRPLARQILDSGAQLVATSCGACKMQINQATGLQVVHPLSLLLRAYSAGEGRAL
jgi:FAD/FMN-containing dehydrogenase/Fe-S oxidoreductase